ncbi:DUF4386 domain-containing protein [Umezawaea sp. NPDC059074]|uniref:DUF4386 domain-containing protein n=1 Tax=Umezawaea sp. NPDC059074 TaxID=3346716 RepID=UPI0036876321
MVVKARLAGVFYLVLAVCGGFSELVVRAGVVVPGDAAATAANVRASAGLFRVAFATDVVNIVCFLVVAVLLHSVLGEVDRMVAMAMVLCNAVAVAIMAVNMVNHLGALRAATSDDGLVLRLLEAHADGYLVAQVFFGLWLLPLGYLVFRSGWFPRALGVVVMAGSAGYLGDLVVRFAAADLRAALSPVLLGVASLAEVSLLLWLLVRSVRVPVPQAA